MIGRPTRVASRVIAALFGFPVVFILGLSVRTARADTPPPKQAATVETKIEVEKAPEIVRINGPLGTAGYRQTEQEKPFLEKTPEGEQTIGSIGEETAYDLAAHKGKYVSWFGIVRSIKKQDDGYELLLEHKYFDGLTDLHILALSFNGAGDFKAILKTHAADFHPLELVRVYGTVTDDPSTPPMLRADYVRVFPWKTFTFLDCYGKDQTNPVWRKLCKVPLDDIYSPVPNERYYRERLGDSAAGNEPTTTPAK